MLSDEEVEQLRKAFQAPEKTWIKRNISSVITIIVLCAGGIAGYASSKKDVEFLQEKVAKITATQDEQTKNLNEDRVNFATEAANLKHMKKKVDELKEGVDELKEGQGKIEKKLNKLLKN